MEIVKGTSSSLIAQIGANARIEQNENAILISFHSGMDPNGTDPIWTKDYFVSIFYEA